MKKPQPASVGEQIAMDHHGISSNHNDTTKLERIRSSARCTEPDCGYKAEHAAFKLARAIDAAIRAAVKDDRKKRTRR